MKICQPGRSLCLLWITGFSTTKHVTVCFQPSQADRRTASLVYVNIRSLVKALVHCDCTDGYWPNDSAAAEKLYSMIRNGQPDIWSTIMYSSGRPIGLNPFEYISRAFTYIYNSGVLYATITKKHAGSLSLFADILFFYVYLLLINFFLVFLPVAFQPSRGLMHSYTEDVHIYSLM
jgi:hypothetical protein